MKIIEVNIYSPDFELLRTVAFNEKGLSIIYGEVEKPTSKIETTNSIGKTVLLKILNVILGANNSGKDTIKGLKDFIIKAKVKYNNIYYDVDLIIGSSKDYRVNTNEMILKQYREFFGIDRAKFSKQIMLEKRKGLISMISKNATKEDFSTILNLLYLEDIQQLFKRIKQKQEEIDLIGKFNNSFKDDANNLQKEEFNLEMKKKQVDEELEILNSKLENLKISENIEEIAKKRTILDKTLKDKVNEMQLNQIRIKKYNEIIKDSENKEMTFSEVENIYKMTNVEIPEMVKKKIQEVENFYKYLIKDKNEIYNNQIKQLSRENNKMDQEVNNLKVELDNLSEIISENDSFREAIKIYDIKTKEKIDLDTKISEINGKLSQLNNTQSLKGNIDILYTDLHKEFEDAQLKISKYKEFIYDIVNKIYGAESRNPYLNINISDSSYKYKAMPVKIDLSIDGDSGEGITAVKYLIFDLMIMKFNNQIDFLIEDSACFEGIDRRQIRNLLAEAKKLSEENDKQLIVSLNKYLISDYQEINNDIVLSLSENNTLLNIRF